MRNASAASSSSPIRPPSDAHSGIPSAEGAQCTIAALVEQMTAVLIDGAIPDARAEARDLVAAVCDRPRFWPSLHGQEAVGQYIIDRARTSAELRRRGAPFAYAVGRAAFRHLTLSVDERVLIPRQETEVLVDLVLAARRAARNDVVADVGTGSGAIAIALATEGTFARVIGTDIAGDALDVAQGNVERHRDLLRAPITLCMGSGLGALSGERVDVLVSNPPYVAFEEARDLPASVRDWEPAHALFSDDHGLAFTREIVSAAPRYLRGGGLLALEGDARRVPQVAEMVAMSGAFTDVQIHRDLAGRDRFVLATRLNF
jgi:release factor glutamine methyltransferase